MTRTANVTAIVASAVAGLPALVRPQAAAAALGVSTRTLRRYIALGLIRSVRIAGGRPMIPRTEIERLIAEAVQ
jgi:excisionase family DNA binding protein